jgi:hypothetical protein
MAEQRRAAAALLAVLALTACRESGGEGEYFAFDGKLFVFNYRVATATYLVNIRALKPVGDGETGTATFENPAGGDPLVVERKIWPRMEKTTFESPPLRCVVKDKPYRVSIVVKAADGRVLQTLETTMTSSNDQSLLPDRPLVVGPLYTPNPELNGHPGGKLEVTNEAGCPTTS